MGTTNDRTFELSNQMAGDRLYDDLKRFVSTAKPGQAIKPERKLAAQYGISVSSVRAVLARLVDEKSIHKIHGKGNFVSEPESAVHPDHQRRDPIIYVDGWKSARGLSQRLIGGLTDASVALGFELKVWAFPDSDIVYTDRQFQDAIAAPDLKGIIVPRISRSQAAAVLAANPALKIITTMYPYDGDQDSISSVLPSYFHIGAGAARRVLIDGARSIVCVQHIIEFFAGAQWTMTTLKSPPSALTPLWFGCRRELDPIVSAIEAQQPNAIIISDDRFALKLLQRLERNDPDFLRRVVVASHANVGEDILPPEVIRLEIDNFSIGYATIVTLKNMLDDAHLGNCEVTIKPTLDEIH